MITLSQETELEIQRRLNEGPYQSADELLRHALALLDGQGEEGSYEPWVERALREGLEGGARHITHEEYWTIVRSAIAAAQQQVKH